MRHAALAEVAGEHCSETRRGGIVRLRVHGDARRLIEYQQVFVLVNDVWRGCVFTV